MQRLERDHVLRRAGSAVAHQHFARKFKFDDGHIIRTHLDMRQMRSALRARGDVLVNCRYLGDRLAALIGR
jgi:hypothetical protein